MIRRRLYLEWAAVALAVSALIIAATLGGWAASLDNRLYDRLQPLAAPAASQDILIVAIDENSVNALGRWPWSRIRHAEILQVLGRYKPQAIGLDVLFIEPSEDDAAVANAIAGGPPVVLPALVERDAEGRAVSIRRPTPVIGRAAAATGTVELLPDPDGVIRRMPVETAAASPLPWPEAVLSKANGQPAPPRPRPGNALLINYAGQGAFRTVPFASVAAGEVPPELIAGKIVLIGATAEGLGDTHAVPASAGTLLSGIELQANIINTLIAEVPITYATCWLRILVAVAPLMLLMAGFLILSPGRGLLLAVVLAAMTLVGSAGLLALARVWVPPSTAIVGLLIVYILWGWRRLAAMRDFIVTRTAALAAEPGIELLRGQVPRGGDALADDANRLEAVTEQLKNLHAFVSKIIESFPESICIVAPAPDDHVVLANAAAKRLFGKGANGQPMGALLARLKPSADGDETILRDCTGRSFMVTEAALEHGPRIVSLTDITELQRAADERDDLLQFLSHDIRSPNAAIVTLLDNELIGSNQPHSPRITPATVDKIRALARHGLSLADDFVQLTRAKRRPITSEPADLCDIAREAADIVWPKAKARCIRIEEKTSVGEIWFAGDRSMVLRAAINLLDNAVKFAPDRAIITCKVAAQDSWASLAVAGPGPAMPPGRANDPFALYAEGRSADGVGSLGLGLAFVQTTALRHGGEAHYAYRPDYGSLFEIRLPLAAGED
ncbi:histidine kinase [Novosphingobium lubricantis]